MGNDTNLGTSPLASLPDTQVFSRDPEDYTLENTSDTIARLQRILFRQRKARADEAAIVAAAATIKKTNVAAKRKKSKPAASPLDTTI
jgi:hypothetical protein